MEETMQHTLATEEGWKVLVALTGLVLAQLVDNPLTVKMLTQVPLSWPEQRKEAMCMQLALTYLKRLDAGVDPAQFPVFLVQVDLEGLE